MVEITSIQDSFKVLSEEINQSLDATVDLTEETDRKKIAVLIKAINPIDRGLLLVSKTTVRKYGESLLKIINSSPKQLTEKLDFALFFISQAVMERAHRSSEYPIDAAFYLYKWYVLQNNFTTDTSILQRSSLGDVLLDIISEESQLLDKSFSNIKKNTNELKAQTEKVFEESRDKADKQLSEYRVYADSLGSKVDGYIKQVTDIRSELSFVILGEAFKDFITEKKKEKSRVLFFVFALGFLMICAPAYMLVNSMDHTIIDAIYNKTNPSNAADPSKASDLSKASNPSKAVDSKVIANKIINYIPLILIEILLVFYFRIFLRQFNSVNAQLLQLKMRLSVCQFIEGYVDFKKQNEGNGLEDFEKLIFSNLMPSAEQVPSTFDGIDQLSKLLGSNGKK